MSGVEIVSGVKRVSGVKTVSREERIYLPPPAGESVMEVLPVHGDQGVPDRVREVHIDSFPPPELPDRFQRKLTSIMFPFHPESHGAGLSKGSRQN